MYPFANNPLPLGGTWTPDVTFVTAGDFARVLSQATGNYYLLPKIGNIQPVLINFAIVSTTFTFTTAAGAFRVTGFPFTSSATGQGMLSGSASGWNKLLYTQTNTFLSNSANVATLRLTGSGQAAFDATTAEFTTGTNITIRGQGIYFI